MRQWEIRLSFEKVLKKLDVIDAKVSGMPQVQVQVNDQFLATLNALCKLGRPATAVEVAAVTGRARATESRKLNDLFGRGLLTKEKQGNKRLFQVKKENAG
jgi:DNA-binding transcriptional ArsR family regulator